MDAVEVLKEIKESGAGGQEFWYIYAIIVTILLLLLVTAIILLVKGFLTKFLKDMKETNHNFADSIAELTRNGTKLTKMVELHDYQIKRLDEDIKEMRSKSRR
jgi:hypothetical protein